MTGRLVLRPGWRSQRWLLTAFGLVTLASPFVFAIGRPGTVLLDVVGVALCLRAGLTLARTRIIVDPVQVTVVTGWNRGTSVPRSAVDGVDCGRDGLRFTSRDWNQTVRAPRVWTVPQLLALAAELDVPLRVDQAEARITIPAVDELPLLCDLVLETAGERPDAVVKAVRELTGLRLKDARRLVDAAPLPVLSGVGPDIARAAIARLIAEGATVRATASGQPHHIDQAHHIHQIQQIHQL